MRTKGDFRRCTMQKKTVRGAHISYLTAKTMVQSLWRKGQQQWRNSNSSQLVDCSHKFCENTMRDYCANNFGVKLTYVCHPWISLKRMRAGMRQFFFQYSSTHNIHEIRIWKNRDIPQILTNTKRSHQHCQPWAIPRHKWSGIEKEKDLPATSRQVLAWCNHQMWKLSPAAAVFHRHQASA